MALPTPNLHRAFATLNTVLCLYASLERQCALTLASKTEFKQASSRELANPAALTLFTSGSSGVSKGVLLSREALLASAQSVGDYLGWQENDRWLCCLPLFHVGGLSILLRCLVARKTVVLCDGFDAGSVNRALHTDAITHISLVPTMLWRLLDNDVHAPSSLRITLIGGAALDTDLADRAAASGFSLSLSYGMTETGSMIACDGIPLSGVQLRTGDDERLQIKGPMLMQGYLPPHNNTMLQEGWLQTQDRARIDSQGRLHILGRVDDTIISGGENIDLREVERELCKHPQVRACMAVGIPDAEWGQKLVVLVVCSGDVETISCPALSGYKRPKRLVAVDALPLLENGKPDRQGAQQLARQVSQSE